MALHHPLLSEAAGLYAEDHTQRIRRMTHMGFITGKYLEDPHHPDLDVWEPEDPPAIGDWLKDVPGDWAIDDMERLLLALLRAMTGDGFPFAVPCVELGDRYCPLSREAVSDLSEEARDKVLYFPTQLIAIRLIREEDEEVLPESLAKKLLTVAGIQRPDDPFTISFCAAAGIVLELLPRDE
jgi:hypothetical protein